jgi:hypothetical protein
MYRAVSGGTVNGRLTGLKGVLARTAQFFVKELEIFSTYV